MDRINLERAAPDRMSRMEKAVDNLSNVAMNTTASRGRIVDADFALESANLTEHKFFSHLLPGELSSQQVNADSFRVTSLNK